jgi:hypothetical protein
MSEADIIYNHIICSKSNEVVSIEVDHDINLINILIQYLSKTSNDVFNKEIKKHEAQKKAEFNAIVLRPYFIKESEKWIKEVGIPINLWSEHEHKKFEKYFMEKYKGLIK